jgi:hypothetical protein
MQRFTSIASRVLFVAAFVLAGLAAWEKLAQVIGYTLLRGSYNPWHLLEESAVALFFVMALQLREIKTTLRAKTPS